MNERRRIPWERCIRDAISDLKIGGIDCLRLAQIMLEEANVSLPLVQVMENRWRFWRQNKQYTLVADQVQTMSSRCVEYLQLRMKEACHEIEPPLDPWTVLSDYVSAPQSEELKAAADKVRGVLETIAGVIAPDPPDLKAMKLVGQVVLQFLKGDGLQGKKLLHQTFMVLSADDTAMPNMDEFHGILRDMSESLDQGKLDKASESLASAKQVTTLAGKAIQNRLGGVISPKSRI